ncbi:MAG: tetratricopeptide repeat protein [Myxococcales bacterium]
MSDTRFPPFGDYWLRAAAALLLWLSVSLSSVPASAAADLGPNGAARSQARAKLVEGDHFLKEGNYERALEVFRQAYELYPSPKIRYNFGLAFQGMGLDAEALEAFEAFLQDVPDAERPVRANAESTRDALLRRVGTLKVVTDVVGASISIDGKEIAKTPLTKDIHLMPGWHALEVLPPKGAPFTQQVDSVAGQVISLVVRLPSMPPKLTERDNSTADGGATTGRPTWVRKTAWLGAGLSLGLTIAGAASLAIYRAKYHSFNDNPACNLAAGTDEGGAECRSLHRSGSNAQIASITTFVSAGLIAGLSAGLFLYARGMPTPERLSSKASGVQCLVAVGNRWMGSCSVRF